MLGEATLTGVTGALLGTVVAAVTAPLLYRALVAARAARPVDAVPPLPGPLLAAAGAGVLLAVGGGLAASRTAARARPLDAVADRGPVRALTRPRLIAGLVVAGTGAGLAVLTAAAGGDDRVGLALGTGVVLVVAASLLAPLLVGPLARVLTAVMRRPLFRGAAGLLVRAELAGSPRRTAAVAAPAIVAVGFAVLIGGLATTTSAAYPAQRTAQLAGTVAVEQDGAPGLPDDAARALDRPGARIPLPTVLVVPGPSGRTAVDAVGTADPGLVGPGEVVLSVPAAAGLGVAAGDTLRVRFADGTTTGLRVGRVLPPDERRGDVVVDRAEVRAHDPGALTDTAFLPAAAVPDPLPPGTVARDAHAYALADYAVDARISDALALLLAAVSAGYGGLAVVNGIASTARARRPDLDVLAAAGATRRWLVAVAAAEAAVAASLGVLLGSAVTVPPLAALASGLARATGVPVVPVLDPVVTASAAGTCLVAAAGTAALTTARTARRG